MLFPPWTWIPDNQARQYFPVYYVTEYSQRIWNRVAAELVSKAISLNIWVDNQLPIIDHFVSSSLAPSSVQPIACSQASDSQDDKEIRELINLAPDEPSRPVSVAKNVEFSHISNVLHANHGQRLSTILLFPNPRQILRRDLNDNFLICSLNR